jgi:energy-coupling factor transporter ATP-binding protein EcfA2
MSLKKLSFGRSICIMSTEGQICQSKRELLESEFFAKVVKKFIRSLKKRNSELLGVFGAEPINERSVSKLVRAFRVLVSAKLSDISQDDEARVFLEDTELLNDFVEELYNYWRSFERYLVCYSSNNSIEKLEERPYRVFNDTVEKLTDLVRSAYRDLQENITGRHCMVYRQVRAGSQIGIIASEREWLLNHPSYSVLGLVPVIRQMLLSPPLIIDPPMNKRDGQFRRVDENPLEGWTPKQGRWLCYPAKVGSLVIYVFFSQVFMSLGCALANLFEIADDSDLERKPDAVYAFGVPGKVLEKFGHLPTVFFDDKENNLLVAAVPGRQEFGYFGYLKKMVLTLHNIIMMKRSIMPYHGAMVNIVLQNGKSATVLLIGDTAAGKSETLEAFRVIGHDQIRDMSIIADDMGSLKINSQGEIIGYGTEIGAFVRLDDLQQGYAFGQIDRAIIMSPHKTNARAVLPITTLANVLKGYKVDIILYANNYDEVDSDHPIIERFRSSEEALRVFREGTVMAKGTTTSSGIVHTYFANIFGPPQYREIHDELATRTFEAAFGSGVFVGQIRTRLGVSGMETKGPQEGAKALFDVISNL